MIGFLAINIAVAVCFSKMFFVDRRIGKLEYILFVICTIVVLFVSLMLNVFNMLKIDDSQVSSLAWGAILIAMLVTIAIGVKIGLGIIIRRSGEIEDV